MTKVITVINMKGGVGKTTLSVNISYILGRYHSKKILLVDIDPQFNATQYLVGQNEILNHFENKKTVYDILMPSKEDEISLSSSRKKTKSQPINLDDYIIKARTFLLRNRVVGNLDLIPSSLKLINFETNKRGVENLLKKFLDEKCSHYDYIIIDCPPTLSLLTLSAYLASEYYLIPIKPDYLSSLGLPLLERGLEEYEELHGHSLKNLGVVFTMVSAGKVSEEIMTSVKTSGWDCFKDHSSHSTKVAKSIKSLNNFYSYAANKRYSEEFKSITQELLNKL
ncbi:ParA family protein [Mucilaginibacter sp. BJC16-A38]|uniref:ParA family protein n=1 Tax=Mucilaginibacter phenanthrenivorans TaxID=1234842 RepID=UPI0021587394|nr:ParA family protein [Mucilaginibacter phenanthrenivorans]MCR8561216.1 ParA family protein [Mucilaginibacter phenanthrenivorans]